MKKNIRRELERRKRRIRKRLDARQGASTPAFGPQNVKYELASKQRGMVYGGVGAMLALARACGLDQAINQRVQVLKAHRPYTEADHVINLALNALCDGDCLQDLELRRNDEVFLDAVGAQRIPDPTTAGDFCRRFTELDIEHLQTAIHEARQQVWQRQPKSFFTRATLDMDGSLVETTGECKQGMDIAYNGTWGYHPLILSLANTQEVLWLVNRSGNRPSHDGAAAVVDRAIALCREAGFQQVRLRGDTDFSQTAHLDRWDEQGVEFLFGLDAAVARRILADDLLDELWSQLQRPPRYTVKTQPRQRPENVKQQIVELREFQNFRLVSEEVAECEYRPAACQKAYRLIIVRKNIDITRGQQLLFEDYRYFFYLTNIPETPPEALVREANGRCHQENLIAQLSGGVRALHAPVNTLLANWAYMVMTALAWNLKAWAALWLPESPGRWQDQQRAEKQRLLGMEFKTFVNQFLRLPVLIVKQGRRLIYRVLSWNPSLATFFRLTDCLHA